MEESKVAGEDKQSAEVREIMALDLQEVYVNGFQIAVGNADMIINLQRNGKFFERINLSFTVAKSLAQALTEVVQQVEVKSGMDIKTTGDLAKTLIHQNTKPS